MPKNQLLIQLKVQLVWAMKNNKSRICGIYYLGVIKFLVHMLMILSFCSGPWVMMEMGAFKIVWPVVMMSDKVVFSNSKFSISKS